LGFSISVLGERLYSTLFPKPSLLTKTIIFTLRARIALVDFYEKISQSAAKAIQVFSKLNHELSQKIFSVLFSSKASLAQPPGNQSPTANEPEKHTSIQIETVFLPCIQEIHQ
jgi:hypothetical protein